MSAGVNTPSVRLCRLLLLINGLQISLMVSSIFASFNPSIRHARVPRTVRPPIHMCAHLHRSHIARGSCDPASHGFHPMHAFSTALHDRRRAFAHPRTHPHIARPSLVAHPVPPPPHCTVVVGGPPHFPASHGHDCAVSLLIRPALRGRLGGSPMHPHITTVVIPSPPSTSSHLAPVTAAMYHTHRTHLGVSAQLEVHQTQPCHLFHPAPRSRPARVQFVWVATSIDRRTVESPPIGPACQVSRRPYTFSHPHILPASMRNARTHARAHIQQHIVHRTSGGRLWYAGGTLPDDCVEDFIEDFANPILDLSSVSARSSECTAYTYSFCDIDTLSERLGLPWSLRKDQWWGTTLAFTGCF